MVEILLQRNGTKVDFIDGFSTRSTYDIHTIRAPTDTELTIITARYAAFGAKLQDFYPVLVTDASDSEKVLHIHFLDQKASIIEA